MLLSSTEVSFESKQVLLVVLSSLHGNLHSSTVVVSSSISFRLSLHVSRSLDGGNPVGGELKFCSEQVPLEEACF